LVEDAEGRGRGPPAPSVARTFPGRHARGPIGRSWRPFARTHDPAERAARAVPWPRPSLLLNGARRRPRPRRAARVGAARRAARGRDREAGGGGAVTDEPSTGGRLSVALVPVPRLRRAAPGGRRRRSRHDVPRRARRSGRRRRDGGRRESRHVPLSCRLHDGVAQVRDPRSVYVLARATPAELAAFRAPPSGWRIVGGVARSIREPPAPACERPAAGGGRPGGPSRGRAVPTIGSGGSDHAIGW